MRLKLGKWVEALGDSERALELMVPEVEANRRARAAVRQYLVAPLRARNQNGWSKVTATCVEEGTTARMSANIHVYIVTLGAPTDPQIVEGEEEKLGLQPGEKI